MSGTLRRVIELSDGLILTTNYDRVVEAAWGDSFARLGVRREVAPLLATSSADLERALIGGAHAVLKLHGDVDKPESWVLTKDRYAAMYSDPAFRKFLSRFFSAHVPLFIGCSMTEERLLDAMREDKCVGYAILVSPTSDVDRQRLGARLKDRVRVIWLRHEDAVDGRSVYDILEPVLHWLVVRRKVGRIAWNVDTRSSAIWASPVTEFERQGDFVSAKAWIRQHWQEHGSWELAAEYLRFADLAGDPVGWDTYLSELIPSLTGQPSLVTQHAIDYSYGRLLGQSGHLASAFTRHAQNRPSPPHADQYQVRSWFEEGQLRFRTEDFERAKPIFEDVYQILMAGRSHAMASVDVLKFLGTMEVLDTIYDAPAPDGFWVKGRHSNPVLARAYADKALQLATEANYMDGCAWAFCVTAFAAEAKGDANAANESYRQALQVVEKGACRSATGFHIRLYLVGFLRRNGQHAEASEAVSQASTVHEVVRNPDRLRLAEQHLLLAWALDDHGAARQHYQTIAKMHAGMTMLLDGSTRFERRMRRLNDDPRFARQRPEAPT